MKELNITVTGKVGLNPTLIDAWKWKLKLHRSEVFVKISGIKNFYSLANEPIDLIKMSDRFLQDNNSIFHQTTVTYNKMKSNNNNYN